MKIHAKQSKAEWINEIKTDQVKNKECLEKGFIHHRIYQGAKY